jgi:DNA-binding response OmpR family regulator
VITDQKDILIIEDDEALCSGLTVCLRSKGYSVETANDGIDGVETATGQPFDLIILDIMLPRRSGWDVCRDIRQAGMPTPILLLTSGSQKANVVLGLRVGADDFVTKPFNAAELLARIEACCGVTPFRFGYSVTRLVQLRSTCDAPKSRVTVIPCMSLQGNSNCFNTGWNISKRCGATQPTV